MSRPRVVITGIGAVTPAGGTAAATFEGLVSGESFTRAVSPETLRWGDRFGVTGAPPFVGALAVVAQETADEDRLNCLARVAMTETLSQAGWSARDCHTAGLVLGASKGDLSRPDDVSHASPGGPAQRMGQEFGFGAGWVAPVAACATGLIAVGQAWERILWGDWERAVAGGVDSSFHPGLIASYRRLGVLSRERENAGSACRPFDDSRSGFVVGEGAAVVALETAAGAAARGARPLAEVLGYALRSDAAGPLQLPTRPDSLAEAITQAMARANVTAREIDAISLHGTGTLSNDRLETAALTQVFGKRIEAIPAWSCKGAIGHLLGASGAVELMALVLALRNGVVPPTVNLRNPSADCGLGHVMGVAKEGQYRVGLKVSLGFGGHCAAMVVSIPEGC
jgi:3-oxoacyl-[acyl-carrier-protein] synthase II